MNQNHCIFSRQVWSLYADMEESFGTFKSAKAVYDRILDLKIATPQVPEINSNNSVHIFNVCLARVRISEAYKLLSVFVLRSRPIFASPAPGLSILTGPAYNYRIFLLDLISLLFSYLDQ